MQIFISYSRHNRDVVKTFAADVADLGHSVWIDEELSGGQAWWDRILGEIRAREVFVFGITKEALESQACMRELSYAAKLGKAILPVLLGDGVSVHLLPVALSTIQYVNYQRQDKKGLSALGRALGSLPAPVPLPNPLPEPPGAPVSYLSSLKERIDASGVLTFQEQTALVQDLKERLRGGDEVEDARTLLMRLRRRDDLLARMAGEIDAVLAEFATTPRPAQAMRPSEPFASTRRASLDPELPATVEPRPAGSAHFENPVETTETATPAPTSWPIGRISTIVCAFIGAVGVIWGFTVDPGAIVPAIAFLGAAAFLYRRSRRS